MASRREFLLSAGAVVSATGLAGCETFEAEPPSDETTEPTSESPSSVSLRSPAFESSGEVSRRYTCEGANISPPLAVENVPDEAQTLVLVVVDPDAGNGGFTHWLLWNISPNVNTIPEDVPPTEIVESLDGARQGTNDFEELGYGGPCPPINDPPHTYRFTLHALQSRLRVGAGAKRDELLEAMADKRLAQVSLTASFGR